MEDKEDGLLLFGVDLLLDCVTVSFHVRVSLYIVKRTVLLVLLEQLWP